MSDTITPTELLRERDGLGGSTSTFQMHGDMGSLQAALAKAQSEFESVHKDTTGRVGNQTFQYASLTAMIRATRPALTANGLAVSFWPQTMASGLYRLTTMLGTADGYIMCHRDYQSSHSTAAESSSSRIDGTIKEDGLRESYYMRYAYRALCGIGTEDADDEPRPLPPARRPEPEPDRPTKAQAQEVKALMFKKGLASSAVQAEANKIAGHGDFTRLTSQQADLLIAALGELEGAPS